jgi:hypothetical protein
MKNTTFTPNTNDRTKKEIEMSTTKDPLVRCSYCDHLTRTMDGCVCDECGVGTLEAVPTREERRKIDAEIRLEITALRNRMRIRTIEVVSPAGSSLYLVRFEGEHGHIVTSEKMKVQEIADHLRSIAS